MRICLEQAIIGRVIRVLQKCFHPDCFRCQSCQISLVEMGFLKHNGRSVDHSSESFPSKICLLR